MFVMATVLSGCHGSADVGGTAGGKLAGCAGPGDLHAPAAIAARVNAAPDLLEWARGLVSVAFVLLLPLLIIGTSLRGLVTTLNYGLTGAKMNHYKLDDMSGTLNMASDTLEGVLDGRQASFSWRAMLNGAPPTPSERRRLVQFRPVLDYSALTPGRESSAAIRKAAAGLDIASK